MIEEKIQVHFLPYINRLQSRVGEGNINDEGAFILLAPLVLFVYARPDHTKRTIHCLKENKHAKESELFIFSDTYKNENKKQQVDEVREFIADVAEQNWFKSVTIFYAVENMGLAKSVISGVSKIMAQYGKAIVIEDDLETTPCFIDYMNEALIFYENKKSIWSISGYTDVISFPHDYKKDIYLSFRGCSWGWATWQDRWDLVDWDMNSYKNFEYNYYKRMKFNRGGKDMSAMLDAQMDGRIDSWAIRWCYSQYENNKYTVYPVKTKVRNIGLDGSGTHKVVEKNIDPLLGGNKVVFEDIMDVDTTVTQNFRRNFNKNNKCGPFSFTRHLFYKSRKLFKLRTISN